MVKVVVVDLGEELLPAHVNAQEVVLMVRVVVLLERVEALDLPDNLLFQFRGQCGNAAGKHYLPAHEGLAESII